ncbi:MAG: hypothetical protein QOD72_3991, partial [Acidimicrobiaceae bacterium]|nr:hypothetical protein [Acidimicrobiaceae bacterium]
MLAQRQLRLAVLGYASALTGEWVFTVALAVVAFRDGGAAGVGLVAVVRLLPSAVGAPFISAFADRARRERVLAVVSVVRAAAIGGAALLLALDAHRVFVYALFVVATAALSVFHPAHSALVPLLCTTTAELTSANVVCIFMESCATLAGPVLAGALLVWSGAGAVFAAAALMSLVAATLFLRLRYDAPRSTEPAPRRRIVRDTLDGLRTVGRHRELRWLFGVGFAQTYTRGALNVFTVVIAFQLLGIGEPGVAALSAAVGVGGIIGSLGVSL